MFSSPFFKIDYRISGYFAAPNNGPMQSGIGVFTHLGTFWFWSAVYLLGIIFLYHDLSQLIAASLGAEITGLIVVILLKTGTKRARPSSTYRPFALTPWNKYSFPSHHALRCFTLAVLIGTNYPGWLLFSLLTAGGVGFSRIYLSKHYFSDVIAGAVFGVCIGSAVSRIHLQL